MAAAKVEVVVETVGVGKVVEKAEVEKAAAAMVVVGRVAGTVAEDEAVARAVACSEVSTAGMEAVAVGLEGGAVEAAVGVAI